MITFRAGPEHLEEAFAIYLEVFKPTAQDLADYGDSAEKWRSILKDGFCVVASIDTAPAGFAACKHRGVTLHIWNIGTLESFRGAGLCKATENEIFKHASKRGYKRVTVNTYPN